MTKLDYNSDWLSLSKQANWSAFKLAKLCGVSVRTLERHFKSSMDKRPKQWLNEQRQGQAAELLQRGFSIKETAAKLGYKGYAHFSSEFKAYWGYRPSQHCQRGTKMLNCRISS